MLSIWGTTGTCCLLLPQKPDCLVLPLSPTNAASTHGQKDDLHTCTPAWAINSRCGDQWQFSGLLTCQASTTAPLRTQWKWEVIQGLLVFPCLICISFSLLSLGHTSLSEQNLAAGDTRPSHGFPTFSMSSSICLANSYPSFQICLWYPSPRKASWPCCLLSKFSSHRAVIASLLVSCSIPGCELTENEP